MSLLSKLKKIFAVGGYMEYTTKGGSFVATAESHYLWECIDFEEDLHQEILSISRDDRSEYLRRFKKELQLVLDGYEKQKESISRLHNKDYLRCLRIYKESENIKEDEFSLWDNFIYRSDYINYKLGLHEDPKGMDTLFHLLDTYKSFISLQLDINPDLELLGVEDAVQASEPPNGQTDKLKPFLKLTKEDRNNGDKPGTEFYAKVFPEVKSIRIEDEKHLYAMAAILYECNTYFKDKPNTFSNWVPIIAHKLGFHLEGKGYNKSRLKESVAELKSKYLILDNLK